ncbi:MAG: alkaline phosphatase D family protein [Tatlockia sp.]|jgi:hypothetical protein
MPKSKLPVVKNIVFGELEYVDRGVQEPPIEEERVGCTISILLNKKYHPNDFDIKLFSEEIQFEENIPANNADTKALRNNQDTGRYLHFYLNNLACKTTYRYQILYKNNPLLIQHLAGQTAREEIIIRTPPARLDPEPIKIAVGGDQERLEQFGPIGRWFDINNLSHTQLLYDHMGQEGDFEATASEDIAKQPYQLFIHLGDLFNGEFFFSARNLLRRDRKLFEPSVNSLSGFRGQLAGDFGKPVRNNLAHLAYGFYAVADDHDTGKNDSLPPKTEKEFARRRNMEMAFHEFVLMPSFLSEPLSDFNESNELGRAGPYYKKRIGQSEFFFLHNRFTMDVTREDAYLLGEDQWQWLEESLQHSTASNKVLISPLPFVMGKKPTDDYRAHWQEWHRLMQLCRQYDIATILTADSHNYSHSEIHVREFPNQDPWIIHQHLIGTLGGSQQHICAAEMQQIELEGRPPLLPQGEGFDATLYAGSTVKAYFTPGSKQALLPERDADTTKSQWTKKGEWHKNTHAYAGMIFKPLFDNPISDSEPEVEGNEMEIEKLPPKKASQVKSWQVESSLFTCTGKRKNVIHEERLDCQYVTDYPSLL